MEWPSVTSNPMPMEPPVVTTPVRFNYRQSPKITGWPWPALSARSEEGRHKLFSIAFINFAFVVAPLFAVTSTMATGYEVSTLTLMVIVPLAIIFGIALGLGQTWIVDNAYREGKSFWQILSPFYLQFYVLTRWAICWRPMLLIMLGTAFYVPLLFFFMVDLGPRFRSQRGMPVASQAIPTQAVPTQVIPPQSQPFESATRASAARRSASKRSAASTNIGNSRPPQKSDPPTIETVWSYDSLAVPATTSSGNGSGSLTDSKPSEVTSLPVLSPVFEEDDGFREWSNLTGSYKVEAKFLAVEGEFVQLSTKDGRKIRVEIAKLSSEDRRFLEPILQSSPFETVGGR